MGKKFSQPSEGASVSRVDSGSAVADTAKDVKDKKYRKAAGRAAGAAVGAYVGGEAGAKVGSQVGAAAGDKLDKDKEKKDAEKDKEKDKEKQAQDSGGKGGKNGKKSDSEDKEKEEKDKKKDSGMSKVKQAARALQAAQMASQAISMANLIMMLKLMLQMAMALAQAAIGAIAGAISAIAHAVVTAVMAVVNAIGAVATAVVGGLVAVAVTVAVVVGVASVRDADIAQRDDGMIDCGDDTSYMRSGVEYVGNTLENAKKVYAFFKAYGLADTNIAGILGNWSHESGIDSTGVETIFVEPFLAPLEGTRKGEIWQGPCRAITGVDEDGDYIWSNDVPIDFRLGVKDEYGNEVGLVTYTGHILNKSTYTSYHAKYPAINYVGIGLGQWTNGRNRKLLEYADMFPEFEWYDLELQLMFCVDAENGDYSSYVNKLASWHDEATPTAAAKAFCEHWEGITFAAQRGASAEKWMTEIANWVEGVDYDLAEAESLLAAANASGAAGADRTGSRQLRSCSGLRYADNTSAAQAIVSFAWGPGESYDNDGTECWQHIFESILPGDQYYRCCDRTVAVAVRWSGTDTEYEYAGTGNQLKYLLTSPRWEKIEWDGDKNKLLPGDVLIRNDAVIDVSREGEDPVHHTLMYVGNDIIKAKFGEEYNGVSSAGFEVVSGSINQYSPHVGKWSTSLGSGNYPSYYAFRNIEKFNDRPEWTDLSCVS